MELKIEKIQVLTGHSGAVYALEKAAQQNLFYSGGSDKMVVEWNLETFEAGTIIAKATAIVYVIKHFAAANLLFIGQSEGGIHVIDLKTKKEIHLLQFHKAPVFDIFISGNKNLLIACAGDGTVSFSSLDDLKTIRLLKIGDSKLRSIELNEIKNEVYVGSGDGNIFVISLKTFKVKKIIEAHQKGFSVNIVKLQLNGKFLLCGSRDAHLNIFDAENNFEPVKKIPAHNYAIYDIVFSQDEKLFATASRDKTVKIWDAENFNVLVRLDKEKYAGHLNSVNKLLWSNYNNYLISTGDDRAIIVWKISE